MLETDLTPLPSPAIGDADVVAPIARPADATRLTRVIGEETRSTAVIHAPAPVIAAEDPFEAALGRCLAPVDGRRDRALIAAVMERIPVRRSEERVTGAAALLGTATAMTVAGWLLLGASLELNEAVGVAVVLFAVLADARSLLPARPRDIVAAAGCLGVLMLTLGVAQGDARLAAAMALGTVGTFGFAWSWIGSAAADRRLAFARAVGGASFLVAMHAIDC